MKVSQDDTGHGGRPNSEIWFLRKTASSPRPFLTKVSF